MATFQRHRRLRRTAWLRDLVREHRVHADDLVYPMFVEEGLADRSPITSMPGIDRFGLDAFRREIVRLSELGLKSIILFGIPLAKDELSSSAYAERGVVQEAIRAAKAENPDLIVMTDVCLCEYNPLGHCGVVHDGKIVNDPSLDLIAKTALSHAAAGADVVAPSDMMDGRVARIRETLDDAGYEDVPILSYAVKYASAFYGPFREAADSAPAFGDRKTYQMDPANAREALREAQADIAEGADMLMVKPALSYLDVTARLRETFALPIATYNVSAEYSMVKAAAVNGWIDERAIVLEMMTSFKRAGADIILTYHAPDVLQWLREERG
ncbi:delta-aminolevulinic acid dehydratase [Alicyclobacillus hesperidum subsp. aegles]|uniref:porphobilinogen synthase n=1 Tax=Alicyclobacillus hesperidum TaxID=89784 RepID=UPI0007190A83|nr:porphobilinogen synthase [Alicyclobacillus hesperidum]KRW92013.1 delta-aminolevulinic acid dehydratase [Alicyclobacillus tengchongensis]GLG00913.1 delta-aminolevulinic acid dehydratase [Alicyclobacillus hesperidum subsp. aegles]